MREEVGEKCRTSEQGSGCDGAFVDSRSESDVYMNCYAPRTLGSRQASRQTRISLLRASVG